MKEYLWPFIIAVLMFAFSNFLFKSNQKYERMRINAISKHLTDKLNTLKELCDSNNEYEILELQIKRDFYETMVRKDSLQVNANKLELIIDKYIISKKKGESI